MQHIQKIMNGFTARFGGQELKDGQSRDSVRRSWERALGQYSERDLVAVCQHWCDTAKYPRWPELGELLERIREWGIKPQQLTGDNRPPEIIRAESDAGVWYRWLLTQAGPAPFVNNGQVLNWVLDDIYPPETQEKKLSFAATLTRAFLHGVLPAQWEERSAAAMARYEHNKNLHKAACEKYGTARVNETRDWMALGANSNQ